MASITEYFEQAQISMAAYALNLTPGISGTAYTDKLKAAGMSPKQAEVFADTYSVVDQIQDPTGFSATVFEDTSGVRYTAIRGTELFSFSDWETNIADIFSDGIAIHQGLAMFNWFQRLVGKPGSNVDQYSYQAAYIDENNEVVPAAIVTTTGIASGSLHNETGPTPPMTVTGHSLGGHLAMMLSRMAPGLVSEVYTYNAPGFDRGNVGLTSVGFFNILLHDVTNEPATGPIGAAWNSGIMSLLGVEGDAVHTFGTTPIAQKIIFAENPNIVIVNPFFAHSKELITESVAVYSLFATIAPNVTVDTVTNILKSISHTKNSATITDASLETALDALRVFVADYQGATSTAAVTPTVLGDRDSFYTNLINLQAEIRNLSLYNTTSESLGLTVFSLTGANTNLLVNDAKESVSVRYALAKLNPFTITGNPALYDQINFDGSLDLYNPTTGTGALTDQYLQDRARFLVDKLWAGTNDRQTESNDAALYLRSGDPAYFEDRGGADISQHFPLAA